MVVQTEQCSIQRNARTPAVLGRSGEITESDHLVERRQQELEPTLLPFTVVTPHMSHAKRYILRRLTYPVSYTHLTLPTILRV